MSECAWFVFGSSFSTTFQRQLCLGEERSKCPKSAGHDPAGVADVRNMRIETDQAYPGAYFTTRRAVMEGVVGYRISGTEQPWCRGADEPELEQDIAYHNLPT
jgi:hypothetical protein